MKKFIFVMPLMAISLLASCGGEKKPFNPLKIDLYKKEIMYDETGENIDTIVEYEYNKKGLRAKDIKVWTDDPNYKQVNEYTYDKHENEILTYNASYEGEKLTDQFWMKDDYTYDKKSRVTKRETKVSYNNKDWKLTEYFEHEYKENAEIIKHYHEDDLLDYTTTYTYDEKGNLISEKMIIVPGSELILGSYERIYKYDDAENGCATKIEYYRLLDDGETKILVDSTEITYLNNLWYRPLKGITTTFVAPEEKYYSTTIREYDEKNRITLYKEYSGIEEGDSPYYNSYIVYEY